MINLDNTNALNRIAAALEDISRGLAALNQIAGAIEFAEAELANHPVIQGVRND